MRYNAIVDVIQLFCLEKNLPNLFALTTSTGLYRSCAALACFSGTFDLILYEAVILNLWLRRFGLVKFGLVWTNLALLWLSLVWFGLVVPQTNKQMIII